MHFEYKFKNHSFEIGSQFVWYFQNVIKKKKKEMRVYFQTPRFLFTWGTTLRRRLRYLLGFSPCFSRLWFCLVLYVFGSQVENGLFFFVWIWFQFSRGIDLIWLFHPSLFNSLLEYMFGFSFSFFFQSLKLMSWNLCGNCSNDRCCKWVYWEIFCYVWCISLSLVNLLLPTTPDSFGFPFPELLVFEP